MTIFSNNYCWVIHHPPLDFHGAGGRGRRPWLCKYAPSSRTGADSPQAEERAIAADAHCIAWVPCDEFLFYFFLADLKKNEVCPVAKKKSRQIAKCMFLFKQSFLLFSALCREQSTTSQRSSTAFLAKKKTLSFFSEETSHTLK